MFANTFFALTLIFAATGLQADEATSTPLVSNAVTVEGTASIEVTADKCRLEFPLQATGETAADAVEGLAPARKAFEDALKRVARSRPEFEYEPAQLARRSGERRVPEWFEARQKAIVRLDSYPSEEEERREYLSELAAAGVESRAVPEDHEAPVVLYEISNPRAVQATLSQKAVDDAAARMRSVREVLGRGLGPVRAAYFPAALIVEGRTVSLATTTEPLVVREPQTRLSYTVRVAFALEL